MTAAYCCVACNHVYRPADGDPARGVPPATPFDRLPDYWRCPGCGGGQHGFRPPGFQAPATPAEDLAARVDALLAFYRRVWAEDMADTLICNPALTVAATEFRPHGPGWFGVVVTPWFLNGVLLPADSGLWAAQRDGDASVEALPAGAFNFNAARVGTLGVVKTMAIVSAMNVFTAQADALAAAGLALDQLFTAPPAPEPAPEPAPVKTTEKPAALSRRALFGRGGS